VNSAGFIGTAIFQPMVGWVLDRADGNVLEAYRLAAALLAAIACSGVVAAFLIRETNCRNVYVDPVPRSGTA
jgi:MFS family permease